jgi:hypothetical protein
MMDDVAGLSPCDTESPPIVLRSLWLPNITDAMHTRLIQRSALLRLHAGSDYTAGGY